MRAFIKGSVRGKVCMPMFVCEAAESDVVLGVQAGAWQFPSHLQCFFLMLHMWGSSFQAARNVADSGDLILFKEYIFMHACSHESSKKIILFSHT